MKVLISCELSGKVRDAFRKLGHEAYSNDVYWADSPYHLHCDVRDIINDKWDMMIAHPPCTHLAVSGAKHFKHKTEEQAEAIKFVRLLMDADIEKIAIENPVSIISTKIRKPDQIIQPWQFGHGDTKSTCLWLKNLPLLEPTNIVGGRFDRTHNISGRVGNANKRSSRRIIQRLRSVTYDGIAEAMANQWGGQV